jgi:hypothetical protein
MFFPVLAAPRDEQPLVLVFGYEGRMTHFLRTRKPVHSPVRWDGRGERQCASVKPTGTAFESPSAP